MCKDHELYRLDYVHSPEEFGKSPFNLGGGLVSNSDALKSAEERIDSDLPMIDEVRAEDNSWTYRIYEGPLGNKSTVSLVRKGIVSALRISGRERKGVESLACFLGLSYPSQIQRDDRMKGGKKE